MAFDKLKRLAGVGVLDIRIDAPEVLSLADGVLPVDVEITAKQDCEISSVYVCLLQRITMMDANGDRHFVRDFGGWEFDAFELAAGESISLPADIPLDPDAAMAQDNAWNSPTQGSHEVAVTVDLVGAANRPDKDVGIAVTD